MHLLAIPVLQFVVAADLKQGKPVHQPKKLPANKPLLNTVNKIIEANSGNKEHHNSQFSTQNSLWRASKDRELKQLYNDQSIAGG